MNGRKNIFQAQVDDLARLSASSRRRKLIPETGVDFSSNDYLGLGRSGLLAQAARAALDRGVSVGSGGSRLLRGNNCEHEALEEEAAAFFGSESATFFATGYGANSALFATLPQRGDLIVHDALIHASAHEGIRLGRAQVASVQHNDPDHFEAAIQRYRQEGGKGTPWIAVESLYSMDGDRAPLGDLAAIAARHDAALLIDEAHATGVLGKDGRGLADDLSGYENVITLRTCGKALGCEGALICGSAVIKDFLVNRARGFIFSTAPSPLMAAIVRAALEIIRDRSDLRDELWARVRHAQQVLASLGASPSGSQIIPIIIGRDDRTMAVASALQAAGFDVRGIRPPTVPRNTARLRISITLNAAITDIDRLGDVLSQALIEPRAVERTGP